MSKASIAPWSQMDDDLDERQDATAGVLDGVPEGASEGEGDLDSDWSGGTAALSGIGVRALQVSPYWSLVPLGGAALWLVWGLVAGLQGEAARSIGSILGVLGLVLTAGAILIVSRASRRAAINSIYRALSQNDPRVQEVVENLPVAAELRPIWRAVRLHAHNIQQRVNELLNEHKQIGLELSLTNVQKRQTEAIVHSVSDPLLAIDPFDQVIVMNTAAGGLFGVEAKQTLRKPLAEVIADEKLVRMIRQAREADSRAAHRRMEYDINARTFAITMAPLMSGIASPTESSEEADSIGPEPARGGGRPTGESHGVVALFRDITKEREATKMKSEFVARAAHELRTPLTSIRAYVEMLVDGEAADEKTRAEYLDIIQTSADRLGRMIDNVLNISRIEAGTIRVNKEPVAVAVVTKEAIDVVRPQAESKKLTLTEDLAPVMFRVQADRDMLYQAILNLLSNAIKYTPEGGRVQVRISPREADRTISIEVSDTGAGIPKEDLPRMFEKFFRVAANQKMAKGTGLGLNLVRHIVETIHEGKVTLTSEVGKGSTFSMILPLCP